MKTNNLLVLSVARYIYDEETCVEEHSHNFYHALVVAGGHGHLIVDGQTYIPANDDVFFIPPGIRHSILSQRLQPLRTLEWKFHCVDADLCALLQHIPVQFIGRSLGLRSELEQLVEEAIARKPLFREIISARALELLLRLARFHLPNGQSDRRLTPLVGSTALVAERRDTKLDKAASIAAYIETHFADSISLALLARTFHMSTPRLSHVFRDVFTVAPMQYVLHVRLLRVKELLADTELSVTDIAGRTGFGSVHYLSRSFSRHERMTPLAYRQQHRQRCHFLVSDQYRIVDYRMIADLTTSSSLC